MPAHSTKIVFTFIAVAALAGCVSPAWYGQAMSGHMAMMHQREDIDDLLLNPDTDPELAARLQLAREARHFGIEQLSLPDTDSYTQYVPTGRSAATWNVVVAPEFSVEPRKWCFPVAGCVPYRGYFREDSADQFAARMSDRGYDTSVTPAVAYSTLGWFDDPLLDTMLNYSDAQLAATIFHEMAHQELYVRGDAAFSEGFAVFVEEKGLEAWLLDRGDLGALEKWRDSHRASARFSEFLAAERERLVALYSRELPKAEMRSLKQEAFNRMAARYRDMVNEEWNGRSFYSGWFEKKLNNARLALAATYLGGSCAFQLLYAESGNDFAVFLQRAAEKAALPAEERASWLVQDCAGIASTGDL